MLVNGQWFITSKSFFLMLPTAISYNIFYLLLLFYPFLIASVRSPICVGLQFCFQKPLKSVTVSSKKFRLFYKRRIPPSTASISSYNLLATPPSNWSSHLLCMYKPTWYCSSTKRWLSCIDFIRNLMPWSGATYL